MIRYPVIQVLHKELHLSIITFVRKVLCIPKFYGISNIKYRKDGDSPVDSGQNSFRRGVMSLVILSRLEKEDMYGYQLVQQTIEQSGGRIVTQEGSLYPVLYKLLDQGYISDRRVQVGRRMTRIYYHLESAGAQRLQELIGEYRQTSRGIDSIVGGNEK